MKINWKLGRQEGGYKVWTWFSNAFLKADCHVIKYEQGCFIMPHKDPAKEGYRHYRLNVVLKNAKRGGELDCENVLFRWWRVILFRPDLEEHFVSKIEEGSRYVLSLGWLRKMA